MSAERRFGFLRLLRDVPETIFFAGLAVGAVAAPMAALLLYVASDPDVMKGPARVGEFATVLAVLGPCVLIGTLMNTAVIGCCAKRFLGGKDALADGWRTIAANFAAWFEIFLLTFSAVSLLAFVSTLIDRDERTNRRTDGFARLLVGASSEAMYALSAFVLCAMVVERCRFSEAVGRVTALKARIPDILCVSAGMDFAVFLPPMLWLPCLAVLVDFGWLPKLQTGPMIFAVFAGPYIVLTAAFGILGAIMNLAYLCAAYIAATRRDPKILKRISGYFPSAVPAAVQL